jgi:hypothetical protein
MMVLYDPVGLPALLDWRKDTIFLSSAQSNLLSETQQTLNRLKFEQDFPLSVLPMFYSLSNAPCTLCEEQKCLLFAGILRNTDTMQMHHLSYILRPSFEKKEEWKKKETGFNDSENKKLLVSCLTISNDESFWVLTFRVDTHTHKYMWRCVYVSICEHIYVYSYIHIFMEIENYFFNKKKLPNLCCCTFYALLFFIIISSHIHRIFIYLCNINKYLHPGFISIHAIG